MNSSRESEHKTILSGEPGDIEGKKTRRYAVKIPEQNIFVAPQPQLLRQAPLEGTVVEEAAELPISPQRASALRRESLLQDYIGNSSGDKIKEVLAARPDLKAEDFTVPDEKGRKRVTLAPREEEAETLAARNDLKPADLRGQDPEMLELLKLRPDLQISDIANMRKAIADQVELMVPPPATGGAVKSALAHSAAFLKDRTDVSPAQLTSLLGEMGMAVGTDALSAPGMFHKALDTMQRRADLNPEDMSDLAHTLGSDLGRGARGGSISNAFSKSADLLVSRPQLSIDSIFGAAAQVSEQLKGQPGPAKLTAFEQALDSLSENQGAPAHSEAARARLEEGKKPPAHTQHA